MKLHVQVIKSNDVMWPILNIFILGGEYTPKDCKPLFKVAILIPYRNRDEQLKIFLNYAHNFLQKQNIHYRIFVIEQKD